MANKNGHNFCAWPDNLRFSFFDRKFKSHLLFNWQRNNERPTWTLERKWIIEIKRTKWTPSVSRTAVFASQAWKLFRESLQIFEDNCTAICSDLSSYRTFCNIGDCDYVLIFGIHCAQKQDVSESNAETNVQPKKLHRHFNFWLMTSFVFAFRSQTAASTYLGKADSSSIVWRQREKSIANNKSGKEIFIRSFNDLFTTVSSMEKSGVPSNWADLVEI